MSKNEGIYDYPIKTLESRLRKIRKRPDKFSNAAKRIAGFEEALSVLRTNNLGVMKREPLELDKAAFLGEKDG